VSPSRSHQTPEDTARPGRGIPEATVARLPVYFRALTALADRGTTTASSEELARAAGVNSAKLRKDLSYLGSYGTRGVGYDVEYLRYQIAREIGLTQDWPVVIVGIGNLGHALANYSGFASRGFGIVGLFDADPAKVGERVGNHVVRPYSDLEKVVREHRVAIGVIATPATAAQEVCDRMVAAGITSILNFAPVVLRVPPGIDVRKVDLSTELQILAYHEQRKALQTQGRLGRIDGMSIENGQVPSTAVQQGESLDEGQLVGRVDTNPDDREVGETPSESPGTDVIRTSSVKRRSHSS
jgi:redox-sensing transcriptional repressor